MRKEWKRMMRVTALLMSAMLALTACGEADAEVQEEETEVVVNTVKAESGTLALNNAFVGTISPEDTVYVMPLMAGVVTDTFFEVGDVVNEGDIMFKIDDENAQLQAEQAKLAKQSAELQAETTMTTTMESTDLQLESTMIQAKSGYENAQIAYVNAKDGLASAEDAVSKLSKQVNSLNKQYKALVDAGMDVSANELLPTIEAAKNGLSSAKSARDTAKMGVYSAQSAYKAAEASRQIAEESADLTQNEVRENTERSLDIALAQADVSVAMSDLALSYYEVKAPVSGIVQAKNVSVNGMAAQGNPAYTIVNQDTMTVTFNVSEAVKNTLQIGQKVSVERNENAFSATITEIGESVDVQTGLFKIKATVEVTGEELPSGVSVKIIADTYKAENAILIPYDAVYYESDGAYVYVNVDGRAKKTTVEPGIFDDETIAILSGLNVGDEVVTSWSPKLTNGVLLRSANLQLPESNAADEAAEE